MAIKDDYMLEKKFNGILTLRGEATLQPVLTLRKKKSYLIIYLTD